MLILCGSVVGASNVGFVGTVTNTYFLKGTYTKGIGSGTGGCTQKEVNELKNLAASLGAEFENDTSNINAGYPVLKWQNRI